MQSFFSLVQGDLPMTILKGKSTLNTNGHDQVPQPTYNDIPLTIHPESAVFSEYLVVGCAHYATNHASFSSFQEMNFPQKFQNLGRNGCFALISGQVWILRLKICHTR